MWKPGDEKPKEASKSSKGRGDNMNLQKKKNNNNSPKTPKAGASSSSMGENTPPKSPASSIKKRLSGATMNMRFMKRKKETEEYETNRKSHTPPPKPEPAAPAVEDDEDPMEMEDGESITFLQATPSDMYGMQADLVGRRSFGGFNVSMEEAWKESKAALEHRQDDSKSNKDHISDEELVKRYQDLVQNRDGKRGVGNLKDKNKRKQKR